MIIVSLGSHLSSSKAKVAICVENLLHEFKCAFILDSLLYLVLFIVESDAAIISYSLILFYVSDADTDLIKGQWGGVRLLVNIGVGSY